MSRRAIYLLVVALVLGWLASHRDQRAFLQERTTGSIRQILTRNERLAAERRIGEEMKLSRAGNPSAMAAIARYMLDPSTLSPEMRQRVGLAASRPSDGWMLLRRAATRGESGARYEVWRADHGSTPSLRSIVESWHGPGLYPAAAELARRALPNCDRVSMNIALRAMSRLGFKPLSNDIRLPGAIGMAKVEVAATQRGFEEACASRRRREGFPASSSPNAESGGSPADTLDT